MIITSVITTTSVIIMKNVNCLENDQNMTQRQKVRECFCRDSVYRCVPHKVAANLQFVRYEMSTKSNKV